MKQLILALLIVVFLLSLQFFLPQHKFDEFNDNELRTQALSRAMKSNPKTFNELKLLYKDFNLTKENILLGKKLFYDTNLSRNRNMSCNTCHTIASKQNILVDTLTKQTANTNCVACHNMDNSGTNRLTSSVGEIEHPYKLNVQTVLNVAPAKYFTWGGEIKSLSQHISNSIQSNHKLNLSKKELAQRYDISFEAITHALNSYIKTLLTRGSYDDFLDGNNSAISREAKKGFTNFINFGCKGCHSGISVGGENLQRFPARKNARIHDWRPNFSFEDGKIEDTTFPFDNKGGFTGNKSGKPFRVAILRNVSKTSPYFHNGAVFKLRKAVDIMAKHQTGKTLTLIQIDEIVEFLKTLDGTLVEYIGEDYEIK